MHITCCFLKCRKEHIKEKGRSIYIIGPDASETQLMKTQMTNGESQTRQLGRRKGRGKIRGNMLYIEEKAKRGFRLFHVHNMLRASHFLFFF